MGEKRKQYTREFKSEAVRLATSGEKKPAQVARELGVRPDMLQTWTRQAEGRGGLGSSEVFPGNGKLVGKDEEIRALRRELDVVKQERDFLKKAAAYFAKGSR
jgi:transposase